jgi:hypothetical protein
MTETSYEGNTYRAYDPERDVIMRDGRRLAEDELDALAERAARLGSVGSDSSSARL